MSRAGGDIAGHVVQAAILFARSLLETDEGILGAAFEALHEHSLGLKDDRV